MQIDIWSDVVCPWCYIGLTRFDRAIENFDGPVDVRLHPFQLDPEAPIPGRPAMEHYERKFGNQAASMNERVVAAGREDGLEFHFDRAITGNTFDAHRAIGFARRFGKDRELEQRLFAAYFTNGKDVSNRNVLADEAAAIGIDRDAIAAYLATDEGVEELSRELDNAYEKGITSVPSFVFNQQFLIPGALDEASFAKVLEQMRALDA